MPSIGNHAKGKGPKQRGAPSLFKQEYVEQARKLCLLNLRDEDVAAFFAVSKNTLYAWQKKNPKLLEAMASGKLPADSNVAESVYKAAIGPEWIEEVAIKVKTTEFDENGKRARESEDVKIVQLRKQAPPDIKASTLFLGNRQPGLWRNKVHNEVTGAEGKPLVDLSAFSTEQLQTAIAALIAAGASGGDATATG